MFFATVKETFKTHFLLEIALRLAMQCHGFWDEKFNDFGVVLHCLSLSVS